MSAIEISRWVAAVALIVCIGAIIARLDGILHRPRKRDLSRPAGSRSAGILYAFTLGMAPWEKESGRKHWVAYLRGVFFHIGVFVALAALVASPWLGSIPFWLRAIAAVVTGAGAAAGLAATAMRWLDHNERALSVPDDYFAVALTALFVAAICVALLQPASMVFLYVVATVLLLYIPFGKIRHCIYFFYAKFFYGAAGGHRGTIGEPRHNYPA